MPKLLSELLRAVQSRTFQNISVQVPSGGGGGGAEVLSYRVHVSAIN